jgi:hypothetical protein
MVKLDFGEKSHKTISEINKFDFGSRTPNLVLTFIFSRSIKRKVSFMKRFQKVKWMFGEIYIILSIHYIFK